MLEQVLFEVAGVGVGALAHRADVHRAVVVYVPVAVAADSILFYKNENMNLIQFLCY